MSPVTKESQKGRKPDPSGFPQTPELSMQTSTLSQQEQKPKQLSPKKTLPKPKPEPKSAAAAVGQKPDPEVLQKGRKPDPTDIAVQNPSKYIPGLPVLQQKKQKTESTSAATLSHLHSVAATAMSSAAPPPVPMKTDRAIHYVPGLPIFDVLRSKPLSDALEAFGRRSDAKAQHFALRIHLEERRLERGKTSRKACKKEIDNIRHMFLVDPPNLKESIGDVKLRLSDPALYINTLKFLPVLCVRTSWEEVKSELQQFSYPRISEFCEYISTTWVDRNAKFPVVLWNHKTESHRTNNHVEGWHIKLDKVVGKAHPNIYELVDIFKREETLTKIKIIQLANGAAPIPRKRKYVNVEERLKRLKMMMSEGALNTTDFLDQTKYLCSI